MKDRKIAISKAQEALVKLKSQLNTLQSECNSNNSSVVTISSLIRTQLKTLIDTLLPNLDDINLI
jgi:capsule polysaccharide export protein KpsE/RkpR